MKLSPLDPFAFNTRMGKAGALARLGRFGTLSLSRRTSPRGIPT